MKFRPTLMALGLGIVSTVVGNAYADGEAARGKTLAYTCHGCHGIPNYKNVYPTYSVPKLGGQNAQYLAVALKAYAGGERPHQTMHAQAASLSDEDRAAIGAFLQSEVVQPNKEVVGTPPPATQTCVACHGADGAKPVSPDYPILAGQYRDYLVQALRDYKSGKRKNPVMAGIITAIDEKDFEAIATFFSKQPGLCGSEKVRDKGKCR
jgi:cytochrome c553